MAKQCIMQKIYGRLGKVPAINTNATRSTRTLWEGSLPVEGVQLFNTMPAYFITTHDKTEQNIFTRQWSFLLGLSIQLKPSNLF